MNKFSEYKEVLTWLFANCEGVALTQRYETLKVKNVSHHYESDTRTYVYIIELENYDTYTVYGFNNNALYQIG